jgi:hypothetical protein
MLQLRELLQMETVALEKAKATEALVQDDELKTLVKSGIQTCEARIKGMMQFIHENELIREEVLC